MTNLKSDPRYTITREFCGHEKPLYIVRFCDEWVSKHTTKSAALMRATGEAAQRRGCLVVEAIPVDL